jgi:signal transduction histidine kinase
MVLSQLPLTVIIGSIALAAPAVWPGLMDEPLFQVSLLIHAVLFALCWVVPWKRLPPVATLSIPAGDVIALILSRTGAIEHLPGQSILMIFPIIWLASSGRYPKASVTASFLIPSIMGFTPVLLGLTPATATQMATTVLITLMLLAVALMVHFTTATLFLQQQKLEVKDAELQRLLDASRKNETLLTTILDTIDVGITAIDGTGHVVLRNRQQEVFRRSAMSPERAGTHEQTVMLFGQDRTTVLPKDRTPIPRAVRGESFADYRIWAGEGSNARALSTAARTIRSESGQFAGAVIAYTDVTSLVETVTAGDELLSTVSHELRTPMTSILGNLELAQDAGTAGAAGAAGAAQTVSAHVDAAFRAAGRLMELVSDLSLATSAMMRVHPRETDLAGLIDSVVDSISPQAATAGIELTTDVPAPLWTHADPLRMGQVLDNLLSNAIKYTPTGGKVAVRARTEDGQLTLDIKDTGMGMTPPDASRVFDKFFRTETAVDSTIPGTGLGLSITKAIVEGHHGTISCRSAVGRGSTFTVRLPIQV